MINISGLYYNWFKNNIANENIVHYHRWEDSTNTYILGAYDKITGKGMERKFVLDSEYEIDKTEEINDDIRKYQE